MSDPVLAACSECGRGAVDCWAGTGGTPALCCDSCDHTIGDIAREQAWAVRVVVPLPPDGELAAWLAALPAEPLPDPGWVSREVEP